MKRKIGTIKIVYFLPFQTIANFVLVKNLTFLRKKNHDNTLYKKHGL